MAAYYCKENDILVFAGAIAEAREYAEHRLSPAYGHEPGRADSLKLKRISAAKAEELDGIAITWDLRE